MTQEADSRRADTPNADSPGSSAPTVAVLDYGSGNLHSVTRALQQTGAEVVLTSDIAVAEAADGLVVPGVGAFAACMEGLVSVGGDELIRRRVAERRPVLGICVGHQVLFEGGVEHGTATAGVGLLPGVVEQLRSVRLPHMGWNTVQVGGGGRPAENADSQEPEVSELFTSVADQRFYFVHSYAVRELSAEAAAQAGVRIIWAEHGGDRFVAAVEGKYLVSTQFHPEKSGAAGARLLANWVGSLR